MRLSQKLKMSLDAEKGKIEDEEFECFSSDDFNVSSDNDIGEVLIKDGTCRDKIDKKLLVQLGAIFFSTYGSAGVLASFLSLFFKELGLTPLMIGCVLCCRPVGGFLAGVLSPFLLRKFPSRGAALVCFALIFLTAIFSLSFVPSLKIVENCAKTDNASHYFSKRGQNGSLFEKLMTKTEEYPNKGDILKIPYSTILAASDSNSMENETDLTNLSTQEEDIYNVHLLNFSFQISTNSNVSGSTYNEQSVPLEHLIASAVLLGAIVFVGEFGFVNMDTISHGITMTTLGKGNSKSYGLIRAWGAIGHGVGALITGAVITLTVSEVLVCDRMETVPEYRYMFNVFLILGILTCLIVGTVGSANTKIENGEKRQMARTKLRLALATPRNISWLVVIVGRSIFYAVTQGFLFWHMDDIGGSPLLIGSAVAITTTTEFFMFFVTPKLIQRFGQTKLVTVGIFSYVVRFVIFSYVSNPYCILPVEVLEGVMYACTWSSIISHLSDQVSQSQQTELAGLVQSLYMIGTAAGFLISGMLTQYLGTITMFLFFAGMASATLTFFIVVHIVCKA